MLKASILRLSCQFWISVRDHKLAVLPERIQKFSSYNVSSSFEHLTNRSLVRVSGKDAVEFLQGLITNDMRHLIEEQTTKQEFSKAMYCMFLDARGRVLLDSLIYKTNSENDNREYTFLIECDNEIESTLLKHLKMYKLRKKVDISKMEDMDIWVEFIPDFKVSRTDVIENLRLDTKLPNTIVSKDPRLPYLGVRHLCLKSELPFSESNQKKVLDPGNYAALRYYLGVGEGIKDIPPTISFPLEINGDYLHGVSFHKGCYVGQELTARTHHTGVVRKRLMPLMFNMDVSNDIHLTKETNVLDGSTGKNVGKVRGLINRGDVSVGLGLLRVSEVLKAASLKVCEKEVKTNRPFWWPEEASKERKSPQKVN